MAPTQKEARSQYATMSSAKKELTALFEAAKKGDVATIEKIKGTSDLAAYSDGHKKHCLHFAAVSGSEACVRAVAQWAAQLTQAARLWGQLTRRPARS